MISNEASLAEVDRAVRGVLDRVYAAWADNDADAFVGPHAQSATAVLPGSYLPDREAIRATMASLFAGELNGSEAIHEVQNIRLVGVDTAIVISKGAVLLPRQERAGARGVGAGDLGAVPARRHLAGSGLPQLPGTGGLSGKGTQNAEQAVGSGQAALGGGPPG